ncbi:hypothetical protein Ancab_014292 [Ancistrocladus abbreviatus]
MKGQKERNGRKPNMIFKSDLCSKHGIEIGPHLQEALGEKMLKFCLVHLIGGGLVLLSPVESTDLKALNDSKRNWLVKFLHALAGHRGKMMLLKDILMESINVMEEYCGDVVYFGSSKEDVDSSSNTVLVMVVKGVSDNGRSDGQEDE